MHEAEWRLTKRWASGCSQTASKSANESEQDIPMWNACWSPLNTWKSVLGKQKPESMCSNCNRCKSFFVMQELPRYACA